ncbi:hypothetical protein [Kitasatospora purpeofusca]|uniref:hypothetical protein n=1 Tax=Kitasatospora purpeofusca TaxID=67352 RepID=UPI0036A54A46
MDNHTRYVTTRDAIRDHALGLAYVTGPGDDVPVTMGDTLGERLARHVVHHDGRVTLEDGGVIVMQYPAAGRVVWAPAGRDADWTAEGLTYAKGAADASKRRGYRLSPAGVDAWTDAVMPIPFVRNAVRAAYDMGHCDWWISADVAA